MIATAVLTFTATLGKRTDAALGDAQRIHLIVHHPTAPKQDRKIRDIILGVPSFFASKEAVGNDDQSNGAE